MPRKSLVVAACLASVAAGATVASLFDFDAFRRFADGLAPDGDVELLDGVGVADAKVRAVFGGLAGGVAAVLLALRRSVARFFASLPARSADAGDGKAAAFERAVAGLVLVAGAALALRNLATPIRSDEANAVLHFSSQSLWTVLTDYSKPQNHVLHTLLVLVAHRLGGWEAAALRAPALLAAGLSLWAAWCFVRREHGRFAASLGTALIATSPLFVEYATNARGYTLMTLFFLLSLLCAQTLLRRPHATRTWALFALCIALGLFTIPVAAFPSAVAVAWMLIVRWRQGGPEAMPSFAARTAAWSGAALALALVLYAPVLAVSGYDALFDNEHIRIASEARLLQLAWNLSVAVWANWHVATPAWAQAALAAMIVLGVGAASTTAGRGRRGTFPLAVVLGVAAVLAVKPVMLQTRFTIFLLCASMMIAGAGGARLIDAVLARLPVGTAGRTAVRGLAVLLVLACFGWWSMRPGVAERFAWETGGSPSVAALVDGVGHELRPGDVVMAQNPALWGVQFYLTAAGHRLTPIPTDDRRRQGAGPCPPALPSGARPHRMKPPCVRELLACLPELKSVWLPLRVDGRSAAPGAPGRLFLFVDDVAHGLSSIRRRRSSLRSVYDSRMMRRHLEECGYGYQVVDLPGGKVYRLTLARCGECIGRH